MKEAIKLSATTVNYNIHINILREERERRERETITVARTKYPASIGKEKRYSYIAMTKVT